MRRLPRGVRSGAFRPRKNARPLKGNSGAGSQRDSAGDQATRQGDLETLERHHRRSLVETKMYCFKRLGERVTARRFDGQVAELQVRAAILNRFSMLARPCTVAVA